MDGILIINKPEGLTSHDVVYKTKKILNTRKVGHTGTLDPMATGVLVICVGKATKLSQYLTSNDKTYEASMKLGIKTDTGDITGNIINEDNKASEIKNNYSVEDIRNIIKSFIGKQKQIPPMYSAIKKDGVKLYELARKGIEVERESRDIEIFDVYDVEIDTKNCDDLVINYKVQCSKGTYIRVLCEDIANKFDTVGTMIKLNRIKSGDFAIEDSIKIEQISESKIISIEKIINQKIELNNVENNLNKFLNGVKISYNLPDGLYNVYTDRYIGIGKIKDNFLLREIIL